MAVQVIEADETEVRIDLTPGEKRHLGALEKRIAAGLQTFREVGSGLLEIRDNRLYRESHGSFEVYCAERWGMPRARAYQLIDSAKVIKVLGDPSSLANEAQAREFSGLTDQPEVARKVWAAVEARASETERPVTAELIRRVKGDLGHTNSTGHAPSTRTGRLVQELERVGVSYHKWQDSKPNVGERNKVKAAIKRLEIFT